MAGPTSRRLANLTRQLGEFDKAAVTTASSICSDALLDQLARDTGGDRRLSGMRSKRPVDVDSVPLNNPVGVRLQPKTSGLGVWSILQSGTKAHVINARKRRGHKPGTDRKSSRARAVKVGGSWRTGPVKMRGTRGRQTWSKGAAVGLDDAVDAVQKAFHQIVAGR